MYNGNHFTTTQVCIERYWSLLHLQKALVKIAKMQQFETIKYAAYKLLLLPN